MYAIVNKYYSEVEIIDHPGIIDEYVYSIGSQEELYERFFAYLDDITFNYRVLFPKTEVGMVYSIINYDGDCTLTSVLKEKDSGTRLVDDLSEVYILGSGTVTFEGYLCEVKLAERRRVVNLNCKELTIGCNDIVADDFISSNIKEIYTKEYPCHMLGELIKIAKNTGAKTLLALLYPDSDGPELNNLTIDLADTNIVDLRIETFGSNLQNIGLNILNGEKVKDFECCGMKINTAYLPNLKIVYYRTDNFKIDTVTEFNNLF